MDVDRLLLGHLGSRTGTSSAGHLPGFLLWLCVGLPATSHEQERSTPPRLKAMPMTMTSYAICEW